MQEQRGQRCGTCSYVQIYDQWRIIEPLRQPHCQLVVVVAVIDVLALDSLLFLLLEHISIYIYKCLFIREKILIILSAQKTFQFFPRQTNPITANNSSNHASLSLVPGYPKRNKEGLSNSSWQLLSHPKQLPLFAMGKRTEDTTHFDFVWQDIQHSCLNEAWPSRSLWKNFLLHLRHPAPFAGETFLRSQKSFCTRNAEEVTHRETVSPLLPLSVGCFSLRRASSSWVCCSLLNSSSVLPLHVVLPWMCCSPFVVLLAGAVSAYLSCSSLFWGKYRKDQEVEHRRTQRRK